MGAGYGQQDESEQEDIDFGACLVVSVSTASREAACAAEVSPGGAGCLACTGVSHCHWQQCGS